MTLKLMFEVMKVPEMILQLPRDASGSNRKNAFHLLDMMLSVHSARNIRTVLL